MNWFDDIELPDPTSWPVLTIRHVGSNETSLMRYTVIVRERAHALTGFAIFSTMNYNDADDAAVAMRRRLRLTRRLLGLQR